MSLRDFLEMEARIKAKTAQDKAVLGQSCERESEIHDQIIAECRVKGWYFIHSRTDKRTTTAIGVPDFVICLPNGVTWFIEVKRPKEKPKLAQMAVGVMLEHLGHHYAVVHSLSELLEIIT